MRVVEISLLTKGFDACARDSFAAKPVRVVIAAILAAIAATGLGWKPMVVWLAIVAVIEGTGAWRNRRTPYPEQATWRQRGWFISQMLLVSLLWMVPSVMMWLSGSPALQMAAVVQWLANLFYAQLFAAKSRLFAFLSAAPQIVMVAGFVLFASPFEGLEAVAPTAILLMALFNAGLGLAGAVTHHERLMAEVAAREASEQAAQAANQAKSTFLATISHEIRTPMNGVLGMAQAMAVGELSSEQRARLDVIRTSGKSLLTLLNDVLDLSKIEAGKLDLEILDFDVGALTRTVHDTFSPAAEAKGVALSLEIDPAARGCYRGDPTRLRQVLMNLVGNALKFTSEGEVALRVRRMEGGLEFAVRDSGIGIPLERQARLFQNFVQAEVSTTREFGGTGLGLAISRQLVELMDGEIQVESEPGRGAEFRVRLPLVWTSAELADEPDAADTLDLGGLSGLKVLAAEDNAVNQLVLTTLLKPFGLSPTIVGDGRLAVEAWEREPWDLVLLDMQMPEMDGKQALSLIRAREQQSHRPRTPVIALTANALSHQVAEYAACGFDEVVAKPIELSALLAAMARAVEPERTTPAAAADA